MAKTNKKDVFRRGGRGVFPCGVCGKSTRNTLETVDSPLCPACYDQEGIKNSHYDGCHDKTAEPSCTLCFEESIRDPECYS